MEIEAIQFLRPDGRQKKITTDISDEWKELYEDMIDSGHRFEMEVLTTGEVSITISNTEDDIDIRVVPNGEEVFEAIYDMLTDKRWSEMYE